MNSKSREVTQFIDDQNHPLRKEIEQLRETILSTGLKLEENIKWNGPNYGFNGEDRITMRIQPPKKIQIIFHCGAKVKVQPTEKIIKNDFGLLEWKENNRAVATFTNIQEIENSKLHLTTIVTDWINAAK